MGYIVPQNWIYHTDHRINLNEIRKLLTNVELFTFIATTKMYSMYKCGCQVIVPR